VLRETVAANISGVERNDSAPLAGSATLRTIISDDLKANLRDQGTFLSLTP